MKNGDLLIAHNQDCYEIKVSGRANFEYGVPLRSFAQNIEKQHISTLNIDLKDCVGMDSTFMGILTMLALKIKKAHSKINILNISSENLNLLYGLGIDKLFHFVNDNRSTTAPQKAEPLAAKPELLQTAETVVDAHDTLMMADSKNIEKFEQVTKFARQDAERLRKTQQK